MRKGRGEGNSDGDKDVDEESEEIRNTEGKFYLHEGPDHIQNTWKREFRNTKTRSKSTQRTDRTKRTDSGRYNLKRTFHVTGKLAM